MIKKYFLDSILIVLVVIQVVRIKDVVLSAINNPFLLINGLWFVIAMNLIYYFFFPEIIATATVSEGSLISYVRKNLFLRYLVALLLNVIALLNFLATPHHSWSSRNISIFDLFSALLILLGFLIYHGETTPSNRMYKLFQAKDTPLIIFLLGLAGIVVLLYYESCTRSLIFNLPHALCFH